MNPKAIAEMIGRQLCRDVDPMRSCKHIASRKRIVEIARQTQVLLHLASARSFYLILAWNLLQCQRCRLCSLERTALYREHKGYGPGAPGNLAIREFTDISLSQWLRRVPSEMLKAHLNIDKEMVMKIPAEKLVVI
jgi:hypothetical protein